MLKLGAYTACLQDRPLREALQILRDLGLTSAEINAGGFIPAPHLPIKEILAGGGAREAYLSLFTQAGITLTGLNVNGNPLNPDPEVGPRHAEDLRQAIEVAGLLGVPAGRRHVRPARLRRSGTVPLLGRQPLGQPVPGRPGLPVA